jgi:hypothetical protein
MELLRQSNGESPYVLDHRESLGRLVWVRESEFDRQIEMRLDLVHRTDSNVHEPGEFAGPSTTTTLGQIRADRDGGSTRLNYQPKSLLTGESVGELVHTTDQTSAHLPGDQVPEVSHWRFVPLLGGPDKGVGCRLPSAVCRLLVGSPP